MRVLNKLFIFLGLVASSISLAAEYPVDPKSGLIMAPGWQGLITLFDQHQK
jgi:hypothetical protein